jgi:hypothetical protein
LGDHGIGYLKTVLAASLFETPVLTAELIDLTTVLATD